MSEKEIRDSFAPHEVKNQMEYDTFMNVINQEQEKNNRPILDEDRLLSKKRESIIIQINKLKIQLSEIHIKRAQLEQQRKDTNRIFHDIKHEMAVLNPKTKFLKQDVL